LVVDGWVNRREVQSLVGIGLRALVLSPNADLLTTENLGRACLPKKKYDAILQKAGHVKIEKTMIGMESDTTVTVEAKGKQNKIQKEFLELRDQELKEEMEKNIKKKT